MSEYRTRLETFTEADLPDLDEVVMGALAFLALATIPRLDVHAHARPLVIGSVNALSTGRLLFREIDAVFADEGEYETVFARTRGIDGVYLISASGSKHAVDIAKRMSAHLVPVYLITSTENAPAAQFLEGERVFVFPHIREPYTYNTSTYLGMLLGAGAESPLDILTFIERDIAPLVPTTLRQYTSYVLTVPPEFGPVRAMFETKFDELFAPVVTGRSFTSEEIKHAKIVIPSPTQYFFNLGVENTLYAPFETQLHVPLPAGLGPIALLAVGYYLIGRIQREHPAYFKQNIRAYTEHAQAVFGQSVPLIVE